MPGGEAVLHWLLAGLLLACGVLCAARVQAHEIPSDVTVQVYLQPAGEQLTVLIRVPLIAMRDFEFATRGPGYLDLGRVDRQLEDAVRLWLLDDLALFENGVQLPSPEIAAVRLALPSDRAFDDFDLARRAVYSQRLSEQTNLYWEQALLDVALVYPITSDQARYQIEPSFARLGLNTLTQIQFLPAQGRPRGIAFTGDPGRMSLTPGVMEVFGRFLVEGFRHVLDGRDHLLFVFALVIPLLRIRPLIVVVTAFTLAHSITLAATLLQLVPSGLWFPPLIELLIAATILYMALENLLKPALGRRWLMAFGFGLIHGFGFSFALRDTLQFAGDHVLVSLAGFNAGIEFGQLLVLVLLVPLLRMARRWLPRRPMIIVLSAFIAHTAWHWLLERWTVLSAYTIELPVADLALLVGLMRWLMLALIAGFLVWLLRAPFERWANAAADPGEKAMVRDRPR